MANILVIDDDQEIRELLEMILTDDDHNVTLVTNGDEGLATFKNQKFDLIITDIMMPKKNGLQLIMDLNQNENTTPIIAISGGLKGISKEFNLNTAQLIGVENVLAKPFTAVDLRRLIKKILGS